MKVKLVKVLKNKIIFNPKGNIIKIINKKNKYFFKFGELYFSQVKKNKTKGWNIHYNYFQEIIVLNYSQHMQKLQRLRDFYYPFFNFWNL